MTDRQGTGNVSKVGLNLITCCDSRRGRQGIKAEILLADPAK